MKMEKVKKLISRSEWRFLTLLLVLIYAVNIGAATNLVSITTQEFNDFRRVLLQFPFDSEAASDFPRLQENPADGRFSITLVMNDSVAYYGPESIKESGRYPIRGTVRRLEDYSMVFHFETIPFEKVIAWYVLGSDQFIFDVYRELPVETAFMEKSVGMRSLYSSKKPPLKKNTGSPSYKHLSTGEKILTFINDPAKRPIMVRALLFSLLIILVISILFIFLQLHTRNILNQQKKNSKKNPVRKNHAAVNKKKTDPLSEKQSAEAPGKSFKPEQLRRPTSEFELPELKTPEDRDRAIRELMSRRNISYDEAAMILMMKPGNLNVKV